MEGKDSDVTVAAGALFFREEELRDMNGVKHRTGSDHVEITCGCTSHRYGDAVGRLGVFHNGDPFVTCDCTPGCREGGMYVGFDSLGGKS